MTMASVWSDPLPPAAYCLITAAHLVLNVNHVQPWVTVTKCLLAPTLIVWTLRSPHAPRQFALAQACCFVGDLMLDLSALPGDPYFLVGMLAFAAAHVNFIAIFKPYVVASRARAAALPMIAFAIALLFRTWFGLEEDLRLPIVVYAALLGSTTVAAFATGSGLAGSGALVFMISDGLILLDVANDPYTPQPPGLWIMATYATAIFLLTAGALQQFSTSIKLSQPKTSKTDRKHR